MDKLPLSYYIPHLESSHETRDFQKTLSPIRKTAELKIQTPFNITLGKPSILGYYFFFRMIFFFYLNEGIGTIKIHENLFNPQEFLTNRVGSLSQQ